MSAETAGYKYVALSKTSVVKLTLRKGETARGHVDMYKRHLPVKISFRKANAFANFYVDFDKTPQLNSAPIFQMCVSSVIVPSSYSNLVTKPGSLRFLIEACTDIFSEIGVFYSEQEVLKAPSYSIYQPREAYMGRQASLKINYREYMNLTLNTPRPKAGPSPSGKKSMRNESMESADHHQRNLKTLNSINLDTLRFQIRSRQEERVIRMGIVRQKKREMIEEKEEKIKQKIHQFELRRLIEKLIVANILERSVKMCHTTAWVRLITIISLIYRLRFMVKMSKKLGNWKGKATRLARMHTEVFEPYAKKVMPKKEENDSLMAIMTIGINIKFTGLRNQIKCRAVVTRFLECYCHAKLLATSIFNHIAIYIMIQNRWKAHMIRKNSYLADFHENLAKAIDILKEGDVFKDDVLDRARTHLDERTVTSYFEVYFNSSLREFLQRKANKLLDKSARQKLLKKNVSNLVELDFSARRRKAGRQEPPENSWTEGSTKFDYSLDQVKKFDGLKDYSNKLAMKAEFDTIMYKISEYPNKAKKLVESVYPKDPVRLPKSSKKATYEQVHQKSVETKLKQMTNFKHIIAKNREINLYMDTSVDFCIEFSYYLIQKLQFDIAEPSSQSKASSKKKPVEPSSRKNKT